MKNPIISVLPIAALLALSACGGAPKKIDSLESARAAYSSASSNEIVVKHAAAELDDARTALASADRNWKDEGKLTRTEHYAYVASQKVKIAELIAQRKQDDARLETMNLERQRVQLDARSNEVDRAREETLAMKQQLTDMQARVTERGIVATLGDVLFDIGEATLKSTAAANIDKIAGFLQSYPERTAIIEGHTDNMGDDDFNLDLARERAFSVQTALVARGIDGSRVTMKSLGESSPIADNNTADGRRKNRRVEIIFPDMGTQVSNLADQ